MSGVDWSRGGARGSIPLQRAYLADGSDGEQTLLQARKMIADELQTALSDEDDELYNPCGEAVHMKNTV